MTKRYGVVLIVLVLLAVLAIAYATWKYISNKAANVSIPFSTDGAAWSGMKQTSPTSFTLDTKYRQPNQFTVYYGDLLYSEISDYSVYDFIIVSDRHAESIANVRNQGTAVFQYMYYGSRFEDSGAFIASAKADIQMLKEQGLADGIFLDECDIAYWDAAYQNDADKQEIFRAALQELTEYIRSLGMESIVNGTRAFADLGDYYFWESYLGHWNTNQLKWSPSAGPGKQLQANGSSVYGSPFSDWSFEGTAHIEEGVVTGGQDGAMEIVLDMNEIMNEEDTSEAYDWIYLEWLGEGGNDDTVSIWAWIGDSLPFDEGEWTMLPKLWKGEPRSWNGIGQKSKYVKLRFEFAGAEQLKMEQILLTFQYNYSYWDMGEANGAADSNPYMWNYNNSQLTDIQSRTNREGSPIKVLAHSYGENGDIERIRYTFLGAAIHGLYAWNYAHPRMQSIDYPHILEEPLGMLLKRELDGDVAAGYFTGGTAAINTRTNTYTLDRHEPAYYYDRTIETDGDMPDRSSDEAVVAPYIPHGYLQSGTLEAEGRAARLTWTESSEPATAVKAWIRTRTPGSSQWEDWVEIDKGEVLPGAFRSVEYCIGLFTGDGLHTPQISDISLSYIE